jgi:hypothetical protein
MSDRLEPILAAITAELQALAFSIGGVTLPVMQRKASVSRQKLDPRAMIAVSKSATPEAVTRRRFGLWQTAYVIDVVVLSPFTGPDNGDDEYAVIRDSIVDAFKKPPLSGATDVFDLAAEPADWLRPYGESTEWDWQAVQVTATVAHA